MYKHWPSRKDRVSSVADLVHRITGLRYIREFSLWPLAREILIWTADCFKRVDGTIV